MCVQCLGDANCGNFGAQRYCNTTTHSCVQCTGNAQCGGQNPYCNPQGRCVECLSAANCGGGNMTCDTLTNRCVPSCQSNADCGACRGYWTGYSCDG